MISQMENVELIKLLNDELTIDFSEKMSYSELHTRLAACINELINYDFDMLIAYLYRFDVNEEKLKVLLLDNPQDDAGNIIATLIIERQQQKIQARELFTRQDNDIDDDEKW
jgi:hypothetical protein